tara:strand:+ start:430 stop:666 length:237 start_codon:yes stop_codon:yes gene_type:complete
MLPDLLKRIAHVRRVLHSSADEDDDVATTLPPSFWDEHRAAMARFRGADEARALERRLRAVAVSRDLPAKVRARTRFV